MKTIKKEYKLAFTYFRENLLKTFLLGTLFFIIASVVFTFAIKNNSELMDSIITRFKAMVEKVSRNGKIDFFGIFLNNVQACFLMFVYGILPFLCFPALSLLGNAVLIGTVLGMYMNAGKNVAKVVTAGILPHGIFELTAVFLSFSMGMFLCINMTKRVTQKETIMPLRKIFAESIRLFVLFIIPLLLVAAGIESYITPKLVGMV